MLRAFFLFLLCSCACAQVKIVAPFPPGGPIDTLARLVGEKFQAKTGQNVIVENRPGGAGNIGIQAVAQSSPDGRTWLFVPQGNITINATLMKDLPFNWERDFAPVTLLAYAPNVLAVAPSIPAKNVQELIAYAKQNPGKLSYGSPGIGSSLHLIGELIKREAGIDIVHVPYKGTTQAMQDLLGGQIGMMFGSAPTLMPQVKAGKVRALAVTTARRSPAAPDLPTLVESGLKSLDVPSWYGMLVPIKTPPATVAKLHSDVAAVLTEIKPTLENQGLYPVGNSPADFSAQIKKETALWARIIQDAGIKPQ
jgi:tripartite-type tricarboxylate transporter receptor subunit TctC